MNAGRLTVLILGGYGVFGGRLAALLADAPQIRLIIAGRSRAKAAAFCERLGAAGETIALSLDRDSDLAASLAEVDPDIVVDATGPFQAYGDNPYRVVRACLAGGINYLDFADGADFVAGISQFEPRARERGVFVLAGVSSFPVLTAAVVRELASGLERIDSVTGGIAPSPYAGVGSNVVRAIASYAGKPLELTRDGRKAVAHALTETRRTTIAPPGRLPLRSTLFSLVEVPDLKVLPALWPELRSVWMGAGPVPEILHRLLIGLAWLVRLGILPSLAPFAGIFHRVINVLRWGEDRGGMFVEVTGRDPAGPVTRSWHLLAEGGDGPLIPSMACEAVIRRSLAGRPPKPGARPAAGELLLADYAALFARRAIVTGIREERPDSDATPLYRRILGDAYQNLAPEIRALHQFEGSKTVQGKATVERGDNFFSRLAGALFGFPAAGENVRVEVRFEARAGIEIWRRTFAGRTFQSTQAAGTGRAARLLTERFGPLAFDLAVVVKRGRLLLVLRGWRLLGLPLPLFLAPRSDSFEFAEDGRFRFNVEIAHRLTGLIVRYRGWLAPAGDRP